MRCPPSFNASTSLTFSPRQTNTVCNAMLRSNCIPPKPHCHTVAQLTTQPSLLCAHKHHQQLRTPLPPTPTIATHCTLLHAKQHIQRLVAAVLNGVPAAYHLSGTTRPCAASDRRETCHALAAQLCNCRCQPQQACCLAADTVDGRMHQRPGETHADLCCVLTVTGGASCGPPGRPG